MNVSFWQIYIIMSGIALIVFFIFILVDKRYSKLVKAILVALYFLFGYWLWNQFILYKNEKPKISLDPASLWVISEEPHIKEYLNGIAEDRPVIIGVPKKVQIKFTDPLSPNSPHAIFQVVFKNKGNRQAKDISIKWTIIDNGNRLTPPNEWYEIIEGTKQKILPLGPGGSLNYIYGPEIGNYVKTKPPKIELTLRVIYKDEKGKEYNYYCKSNLNPKLNPDNSYSFDILEVK